MFRSVILFFLFLPITLWAQPEELEWLYSAPISVTPEDTEITYLVRMKLSRESHIRTLSAKIEGNPKFVTSKTMAYTDPTGYTEFVIQTKHPDKNIRIWVVDELTGVAKAFLWRPGTTLNAPTYVAEQKSNLRRNYIASRLAREKIKKPWKTYPRAYSLALDLGPVNYATQIAGTNTDLNFKVKVAPRGTMEYWHDIKDSKFDFHFRGIIQQVAISQDDVFAPPSSDSNLLFSGETNLWYQFGRKWSAIAGLKYQRDVFLAREDDEGTTVAALQEQDLGKIRAGLGYEAWKICTNCRSVISVAFDGLLFSSGDREFDTYLGIEAHYKLLWRFKEHWQFNTGLSYRFQSYTYTAVDEITSQNLATESFTSDLSVALGGAYLF